LVVKVDAAAGADVVGVEGIELVGIEIVALVMSLVVSRMPERAKPSIYAHRPGVSLF
jgi:hypothetical protein